MELKYEKALKEYNLSVSDLSDDAKIGVNNIKDVLKGINILEKKGKAVSEKTFNKIKAMDKWVYYEILDQIQGSDENEDEAPYESEEVLEEAEEFADENDEQENEDNTNNEPETIQPLKNEKGFQIDKDLQVAHSSGKKTISFEELKSVSKTAYDIIFDGYTSDAKNGVETSNYSLIEGPEDVFTLTKK